MAKARALRLAPPMKIHFIARTGPNVTILRVKHAGIHKVVKLQQHFAMRMSGSVKYVFLFPLMTILTGRVFESRCQEKPHKLSFRHLKTE